MPASAQALHRGSLSSAPGLMRVRHTCPYPRKEALGLRSSTALRHSLRWAGHLLSAPRTSALHPLAVQGRGGAMGISR